jgi:hypothetical protein
MRSPFGASVVVDGMSGLPLKGEIPLRRGEVGFVPIAEVGFGQDSSRIITGVQPADGTSIFGT